MSKFVITVHGTVDPLQAQDRRFGLDGAVSAGFVPGEVIAVEYDYMTEDEFNRLANRHCPVSEQVEVYEPPLVPVTSLVTQVEAIASAYRADESLTDADAVASAWRVASAAMDKLLKAIRLEQAYDELTKARRAVYVLEQEITGAGKDPHELP